MKRAFALALLFFGPTAVSARAEEPPPELAEEPRSEPFIELSFQNTPACLDRARVRLDVESRLGGAIFRERGAPYALLVSKAPDGPVLQVTLTNQLADEVIGTRELQTEALECDEYQALLPVVIAVLLEPYARGREERGREAAPEAPPSSASSAQAEPSPAEPSPDEPALEVRPDFRCGMSGGVLVGFAPNPSAVARQACTLRLPPKYEVDLSFSYRFPGNVTSADPSFSIQAIELRLALCRGFGAARLRLGACGALSLPGVLTRTSAGGEEAPDDFRVLGEVAAFGRLDYEFSTIGFVRVDLGLFVPLARPVYTYPSALGLEPIRLHQVSPVVGNLEVGAGFHWW